MRLICVIIFILSAIKFWTVVIYSQYKNNKQKQLLTRSANSHTGYSHKVWTEVIRYLNQSYNF